MTLEVWSSQHLRATTLKKEMYGLWLTKIQSLNTCESCIYNK